MFKKIIISFFSVILCFSSLNLINISENHNSVYARENVFLNSSNKVIESYFEKVKKEEQLKANSNGITTASITVPKWVKDAEKFAKDALKAGIDFLILDDIKTIFNPNSSKTEVALATVALFPAGKVVKVGKVANLLNDAGKSGLVKAYSGLGKTLKHSSRGILFEGTRNEGWEHIKKRHITGQIKVKGTTTFYPKGLKESQIKNIIMTSLKKGKLSGKAKNGYKTYTYGLNKYGIKNMKVVVDKDNVIITAYPISGSKVKKVK
ncbi:EndoU domain-containing protein [Peribacillus asahii]|uniref:Uncharacterized protein n=1 Tax=Peribacillus asahii TaxID=228899 RepID=A0A3Q9RQM9_9BACI|nr:EndoU domain-containing protein [Peribacillus asahii]AZV44859.1 hypothetical protein BAOM_4279 [Peribacillus asahii]USK84496.1 EndoU domain-containing protein [Peribacillus asahii]